jgi:ribosomal protein L18
MEGARRRLEEVIKLGYTKAEISKTSDGKAAVVVFRSNDKNAAIQVVDKLETKGIDAAVFDRKN